MRRTVLPVLLAVVVGGAVPALADANGSTEQRTVERSCSAPADNRFSAPGPNDCKDGATTYQATHWTNDVKCGSTNALTPENPTGIRVYGSQAGGVGTCAQGGAAPGVQGRAGVKGNATDGATVTVDGDKDNANETAQGWVQVNAKPGAAPTYRCGDEYSAGGKGDSDTPEARDTAAECGG